MVFPEVPPIVTITSAGAGPRELHIYSRDVATFVNNDSRSHDIRNDLAASGDTRCAIVGVGLLAPGESRQAQLQPSGVPCFYRDEGEPGNAALKGYVLVHY
jgi:hypothetical protein